MVQKTNECLVRGPNPRGGRYKKNWIPFDRNSRGGGKGRDVGKDQSGAAGIAVVGWKVGTEVWIEDNWDCA